MARIKHRKARKDYPEAGIKKGEMYYYCKFKTGQRSSRTIRQKEPIKQSQITSSEYRSTLLELQERSITCEGDIEDIKNDLENLGQETRDKYDNMPEGLQQGDTGQRLDERATACDDACQQLDTIASDLGSEDDFDEESSDFDTYAEACESAAQEVAEALSACDV